MTTWVKYQPGRNTGYIKYSDTSIDDECKISGPDYRYGKIDWECTNHLYKEVILIDDGQLVCPVTRTGYKLQKRKKKLTND